MTNFNSWMPKASKNKWVTTLVCLVLLLIWIIYVCFIDKEKFEAVKILRNKIIGGIVFLILFYKTFEFIINRIKTTNKIYFSGEIEELKQIKVSQYGYAQILKLKNHIDIFYISFITFLYLKIKQRKCISFHLKQGYLGIGYTSFYHTKTN